MSFKGFIHKIITTFINNLHPIYYYRSHHYTDATINSTVIKMTVLDVKYVFHIPLYKFTQDKLSPLDGDEIIADLISKLSESGFDSLYMTRVKSCYRARLYDEILITLFTTDDRAPEEIFEEWFRKNNKILEQEEFAYEKGDRMIIGRLYHE